MPTASAEQTMITREQLRDLSASADSYAFLSVAQLVLPQLSEDAELKLQIIRHYATLGLMGPALEIADTMPLAVRRQLESSGILSGLAGCSTGRVPWDGLDARFRANLAVLLERFPDCQRMVSAWERSRGQLELYQCRDGNYQLSILDDRGQRVWLPRLMNHKANSEQLELPKMTGTLAASPFLLEGVGLGWLIERIYRHSVRVFLSYSPAVYILEPNPLALAVAMHLHDWRQILADSRVYVFIGPDAGRQYAARLLAEPDLPMPDRALSMASWGPVLDPAIGTCIQEIADGRIAACAGPQEQIRATYEGRDLKWWARRFATAGPEDPLRVLLPVSRYTTYLQYCIRDVAAAFERHGLHARILMERADHCVFTPSSHLQTIADFRPDLVFIIDHFRREYANSLPANVPFVGWVQDQLPHLYSRVTGESLGPLDFFIAPDPAMLVKEFDYPAEQGFAWTMATDDKTYRPEPLPDEELALYRCDFSYVSHQSKPPHLFLEQRVAALKADRQLRQYMECLYSLLQRDFRNDPQTGCLRPAGTLLEEASLQTGFRTEDQGFLDQLVLFFLHPLAELIFRQGTLEWVADYCDRHQRCLHIYGNGWDQHPRLARYARGRIANGDQLRAVYQASSINLQIVGGGCIHQRLLDGLLSGGFFLIRYSPYDVIHEGMRRTLEAIERYGAQPDTDYPSDQVPELAAGLRELAALVGGPIPGEQVRFAAAHLAHYREQAATGYRRMGGAVLPHYADVSFASPAELGTLADRFLNEAAARKRIASDMQAIVRERYTYGTLIENLLEFIKRQILKCAGAEGGEMSLHGKAE
jgi:hypothetical protein